MHRSRVAFIFDQISLCMESGENIFEIVKKRSPVSLYPICFISGQAEWQWHYCACLLSLLIARHTIAQWSLPNSWRRQEIQDQRNDRMRISRIQRQATQQREMRGCLLMSKEHRISSVESSARRQGFYGVTLLEIVVYAMAILYDPASVCHTWRLCRNG